MIVYIKLPMYASFVILKGKLVSENEDSYIIRNRKVREIIC